MKTRSFHMLVVPPTGLRPQQLLENEIRWWGVSGDPALLACNWCPGCQPYCWLNCGVVAAEKKGVDAQSRGLTADVATESRTRSSCS